MAFALPSLFGKGKQPRAGNPATVKSALLAPTLAVVPITSDGSKALAFGLNWTVLFGQGTRQALVKEHKLRYKANAHIEHNAREESLHGFGVVRNAKRSTAIFSAAVVLADFAREGSEQDAGFLIDLSATQVAFIGIRAGQPDVENDLVGTFRQMADAAERFAESFASGVSLFASDRLIAAIKEQNVEKGYIRTRTLPALPTLASSVSEGSLVKIGGEVSTAAAALIVSLCVAIGLGVIGFQYVQKQRLKSRSALDEIVRNNPGALYLASRDAALVSLAKTPALAAIPPLKKAVWASGLQRAGFTAYRMDCDTSSCSLTWKRAGGTYQRFDLASKPSDNATYQQTLLSLSTSTAIAGKQAAPDQPSQPSDQVNLDASALPRLSELLVPLGTLLQKFQYAGMTVNWVPPKLIGRYEGPEPIETVPNALLGADWTVSGPIDLIDMVMLLPSNFAIKTVSVELPDERAATVFTASGYYYVRP